MNKILLIQGALYAIPAALTPLAAALLGEQPLSARMIAGLIITGIIQGAIAVKAFTSTTYSDSGTGDQPSLPPKKVEIKMPPGKAVPTEEVNKAARKTKP